MRALLNVAQGEEFEDCWLHQLLLQLANLEAIVADDLEVADAEEPVNDFLRLALLAHQQEFLFGGYKVGNPVDDGSCARQPIRSLEKS